MKAMVEFERMWKQASFAENCLRMLRARIDAAVAPGGQETDIVVLRATKVEAAMLCVLIDDVLK